jgi:predicted dienelactone hydrolase
VEGTTSGNLAQLADGLAFGGTRSGTERWADALGNIRVPVVQVTFEYDPLSPPEATYRDDFSRLGSERRVFLYVRGQAHGDFQLAPRTHRTMARAIGFLLAPPTTP